MTLVLLALSPLIVAAGAGMSVSLFLSHTVSYASCVVFPTCLMGSGFHEVQHRKDREALFSGTPFIMDMATYVVLCDSDTVLPLSLAMHWYCHSYCLCHYHCKSSYACRQRNKHSKSYPTSVLSTRLSECKW